jgi:hypothetical protein
VLVGDLIMAVREAATDLPQTLGAPSLLGIATSGGGSIPPNTYFVVITSTNSWGETLSSGELFITVNPGIQTLTLTFNGPFGNTGNYRLYFGFSSGQENGWIPFSDPNGTGVVVITSFTGASGGTPPQRSTAYLPDLDGDAVSAYTMFRWLNDALKIGSQVCGGLLDYSGVGSIVGQPQYIVNGLWTKIASMWYDGYPLAMDDNGNYFRRNAITASVLSSVAISTFNNQMMFEVWPQPSRTSGTTTLAAQMFINQTSAVLVNASNFLLTNGFVQIGQEIMSYSGLVGNQLNNLQRALGGTVQSVIPAGTTVVELNLFWSGWRLYQPNFQPGSSSTVVPVPVGWESIIFEYGLGRMKLAEQNVGDYSKLTESCKKNFSDWFRQNKVVVGPRQIGDQTSGLEVLPNLGGGWVIP